MPRPATGSIRFRSGRWHARITVGGREQLIAIEPPLTNYRADRAQAREEARSISQAAREGGTHAAAGAAETVEHYAARWVGHKEARGQRGAKAARSHLRTHVLPVLAGRTMAGVARRDVERIVEQLDDLVDAGKLRWKSAVNVWGTVTKLFDDASRGKVLALRVLTDSPTKGVRGPDRGVETAAVHLYPAEFLQLMRCAHVPLQRRRAYAIAVYLYLRPGELESLRWERDFDFEHGRRNVTIAHNMDDVGTLTSTKSGRARIPFDLEPEIVPLLEVMRGEAGGVGSVVGELGDDRELAQQLREDLATADVMRHELHHPSDDPPREAMRMHDCRTTGITWMAVRRDEPMVMMARAGHRSLKQTQEYVDVASVLRRGYGEVFPPLPHALLRGGRTEDGPPPPPRPPRMSEEGDHRDARRGE